MFSGQYYFFTLGMPTAHKIFVTARFSISLCPILNRTLTCKQSSEVLTMRGDFDWQASSNGRKYLSASMKFAFGGAAVPSLGQIRRVINFSKCISQQTMLSPFLNLKLNGTYKCNASFSHILS